jgi:hypothetical protein
MTAINHRATITTVMTAVMVAAAMIARPSEGLGCGPGSPPATTLPLTVRYRPSWPVAFHVKQVRAGGNKRPWQPSWLPNVCNYA